MNATLTYTGLRVKDLETSGRFYRRVLGMTESGRWRVPESRGEVVQLVSEKDGPILELNRYEPGSRYATRYVPGEGLDHLAFRVPDLEEFLAAAGEAGGPAKLRVKGASGEWAYIEDPNGLWIEVFA